MRASKENAEKVIQWMKKLRKHMAKSMPEYPSTPLDNIEEFLKKAKAKLPTEKAYDDDAKRKRFRFKVGDRVEWLEQDNQGLGTVKNVDHNMIYIDWDDDFPNDPISHETFLKYAKHVRKV